MCGVKIVSDGGVVLSIDQRLMALLDEGEIPLSSESQGKWRRWRNVSCGGVGVDGSRSLERCVVEVVDASFPSVAVCRRWLAVGEDSPSFLKFGVHHFILLTRQLQDVGEELSDLGGVEAEDLHEDDTHELVPAYVATEEGFDGWWRDPHDVIADHFERLLRDEPDAEDFDDDGGENDGWVTEEVEVCKVGGCDGGQGDRFGLLSIH